MKSFWGSLFLLLSFASIAACATRRQRICPDLFIEGKKLAFTGSERKLLCGDPDNPAWNSIPRQQVIYHLKTFLLERGYYDPVVKEEPRELRVQLGPRARIETFEVTGWPPDVRAFNERRYRRLSMTPASLDEIEAGALTALRSHGYPCSDVRTEAYPKEKIVKIIATPGMKRLFGLPAILPADDIDARTLKRFEAFTPGEVYDHKLLEITERRIRASGLVQDVTYYPECESDEFKISHKTISGKSRFFSIGAGFDTEQLAIAKARISLNRLSRKGSSIESELFGSLRVQSLTNSAKFHVWPPESRMYFFADLEGEHRNEKQYDTLRAATRGGVGTSVEQRKSNFDFKVGPKLEYLKVFRGVGKEDNRIVSLEASAILTSHFFEYFASVPKKGYRLGLSMENTSTSLGSTFSASKARLLGETLFLLYEDRNLDVIWGWRGFLHVTYSHEGSGKTADIPPTFKSFLGGSQNLRGFAREELPAGGQGAMSSAYIGTELRLARLLQLEPIIKSLEPLIFIDAGALAERTLAFESPYYVSPGIGFRWQLPIGSLRTTAAYGYSIGNRNQYRYSAHPQYFFSFGEEF